MLLRPAEITGLLRSWQFRALPLTRIGTNESNHAMIAVDFRSVIMRIFLLSFLTGILSAVGGAVGGLAIGALLIELNCLADPGGVIIIFLLVVVLAFVGGLYGFVSTKFRLQRRPLNQMIIRNKP